MMTSGSPNAAWPGWTNAVPGTATNRPSRMAIVSDVMFVMAAPLMRSSRASDERAYPARCARRDSVPIANAGWSTAAAVFAFASHHFAIIGPSLDGPSHNWDGPTRIPRGRHGSYASLHGGDGAEHGRVPNALTARLCRDPRQRLHETGRAGCCPVARVVVDGVVAKREDGAAVDRAESDVVRRHHRRADEDLHAGSAGPDARTAIEIGRRALDIQIDRRTTDGDDAEAAVGAHQGVLDVGEDDAAARARRAKALEIPLQLDPLQGDEGAARTGIDEDAAAAD